jgi:hypothetical protein
MKPGVIVPAYLTGRADQPCDSGQVRGSLRAQQRRNAVHDLTTTQIKARLVPASILLPFWDFIAIGSPSIL